MILPKQKLTAQLRSAAELESRLAFRLARMSKLLDAQLAKQIAPFGLSLTNARILMVIDIYHEISAADLSRVTVFDKAQISRAIAGLKREGLLEQHDCLNHKRRKLLRLTDAGKALIENTKPITSKRQNELLSLISPEELKVFNSVVDRIASFAEADVSLPVDIDPGPIANNLDDQN